EPAFRGDDRPELLRQIAHEDPVPPRRLNPALPAELETVVLKATAKAPEERYSTAAELAADLRRFLADEPVLARRPTLAQRARRGARGSRPLAIALAAAAAILLLGLLLGAVVYGLQQRQLAEQRRQNALENDQRRRETEAQLYRALLDHAASLRLARQPGYR